MTNDAARLLAQEGLRHIEDAVLMLLEPIRRVSAMLRLPMRWACARPFATASAIT